MKDNITSDENTLQHLIEILYSVDVRIDISVGWNQDELLVDHLAGISSRLKEAITIALRLEKQRIGQLHEDADKITYIGGYFDGYRDANNDGVGS